MLAAYRRRVSLIRLLALQLVCVLVSACAEVVDCAVHPATLEVRQLPVGEVGAAYEAVLRAGVRNTPSDDAFEYEFSITSGRLPRGLRLRADGQRAVITGVPDEAGAFRVEIEVEVFDPLADPINDDGDCGFRSASKTITVSIAEPGDDPDHLRRAAW